MHDSKTSTNKKQHTRELFGSSRFFYDNLNIIYIYAYILKLFSSCRLCVFRCQLWQMCLESAFTGFASDDWSACSVFEWSSSPMSQIYLPLIVRLVTVSRCVTCMSRNWHILVQDWMSLHTGFYPFVCTSACICHVHVHIVNRGPRSQLNSIVFGCEWKTWKTQHWTWGGSMNSKRVQDWGATILLTKWSSNHRQ